MGKRLLPCNLTEEERNRAWKEFEEGLLSREETDLVAGVLPQYLFYRQDRKGRERECICTHCNCGKFTVQEDRNPGFFRKKHGEDTHCPGCGGTVKLQSLSRVKNFGTVNQTPWERITICRTGENGALLLLSGYAKRTYTWGDLRPDPEISWKAFTWLAPGKRMQWVRTWEPVNQVAASWWWDYQWNERVNVAEPFSASYRSWWSYQEGLGWLLNTDAVERSALRYCQLEDWYWGESSISVMTENEPIRNAVKYLSAYTRYPNLEMAVKLGLYDAATDLAIYGVKNHKDLNWEAGQLQGFLRLDKQDARAFYHSGGSLEELKAYHRARKLAQTRNMAEFLGLIREQARPQLALSVVEAAGMAGCSIRSALHYMGSFAEGIDRMLPMWRDYMNMARQLQYDMSRRDVTMPKDLRDRHDAASETIRYQKIVIDEKKHRAYNKHLRKMYEFTYGDLCIRVPGNVEEIIREGKVLQHCVGGYAARHFDDKLHILFLRHNRKPDTPFVTMEIVTRKDPRGKVTIRQIHGYRNEGYLTGSWGEGREKATPAVKYKWFLDVWRAWVEAGSPRDKKGQPILSDRKEKTA